MKGTLKKAYGRLVLGVLLLSVAVAGCGSDIGPAGTDGGKDIGALVSTRVIPSYLETTEIYEVDISQDVCDISESSITVEDFARHAAVANFFVQFLTTGRADPLLIESYKVEFTNLVAGTPPIAEYERFESFYLVNGAQEIPIDFVDLDRKRQLLDDYVSQVYPNATGFLGQCANIADTTVNVTCLVSSDYPAYSARFTFRGSNSYGEKFKTTANVNFFVGNFDYCQ